MGIQFHKVQQGNLPVNVIGDHVYFTDTGRMYVSQVNGGLKEIQDFVSLTTTNRVQTYKGVVDKDFNQVTSPATYVIVDNNLANKPPFAYGFLEVIAVGVASDYIKHVATDVVSGSMYVRVRTEAGWQSGGNWKQIATTESVDLTLLNGWVQSYQDNTSLKVCKSGDIVSIQGRIKSGVNNAMTFISSVPTSFAPKLKVPISVFRTINNAVVGVIFIHTSGIIAIESPLTDVSDIIINGSWTIS